MSSVCITSQPEMNGSIDKRDKMIITQKIE